MTDALLRPELWVTGALLGLLLAGCGDEEPRVDDEPALEETGEETQPPDDPRRELFAPYAPEQYPAPPVDVTNRFADDDAAAALGQKFFFDPRFSGPLLDTDNNEQSGTLGVPGDTGRVACASCHVPETNFVDTRTTRSQISLAAGWTRRKTPSLLDVGHATLVTWGGRRDSLHSQVFSPVEKAVEMNSSRLFVAQQIERLYRAEYEQVFGPMPDISSFASLTAEEAGCIELPEDFTAGCEKPYDDQVTEIVVNFGKAIGAYLRRLSCGPGRFDAWVHGDDDAMTEQELRGAELFFGAAGCVGCHSGPLLTDQDFHNVGLPATTAGTFIPVGDEPGASEDIAAMLVDPLNSQGPFSDGYDGRLDDYDQQDLDHLLGAFRTPSLRCVTQRPSFSHTGQWRTLSDAVSFFVRGGGFDGFMGDKEIVPLDLTDEDEDDMLAFLETLAGPGPDSALLTMPDLPQ